MKRNPRQRVVPMSRRIQTLLEHYFAIHEKWFVAPRQVQKIVKHIANTACITQNVTPFRYSLWKHDSIPPSHKDVASLLVNLLTSAPVGFCANEIMC